MAAGGSVTVLSSLGRRLTKVFKADGSTDAYDDAASFKVRTVTVDGLLGLHALLVRLETKPTCCVIRGSPRPEAERQPGKVAGTWTRTNANFEDVARPYLAIDIDGYRPGFADPVLSPTLAIQDFIAEVLPPCFQKVGFHWQLSSSAALAKNAGILKAHLWFWLDTPYTCAQLAAWAEKDIGPAIDRAIYRRVQIHYTANPIYEGDRVDPVPVRSGLCLEEGWADSVPLLLSAEVLGGARAAGEGSGGSDMVLLDPSSKPGLIGLFHKAFDAPHVLSVFLEEEGFSQVTDRRWTWHGGGGTPEGVWIHDDGMHVGSSHNTWPLVGIANLWDLVRVFKFGHLDTEAATGDEFADMALHEVGHRPSDVAMLKWAGGLPELQQQVQSAIDGLLKRIEEASQLEIETALAPEIKGLVLSVTDRERAAVGIQARILALTGARLPIAQVRRMIKVEANDTAAENAPDWAKYWVWSVANDGFVNVETKQLISERSYNARYDRYMARWADENGNPPRASDQALNVWDTKTVDREIYLPDAELFFTMDGLRCLNTYRTDLSPDVPAVFSPGDLAAIAAVERHAALLIPDQRERTLFIDYLAYCVQKPGAKIRWALLLKGVPGDGKTAFATMMSHILGHQNVRVLSSSTLEGSGFTGWVVGQCMVVIEEVKLDGHNRYDVYNMLKPPISNDVVEAHCKGKDPYNVPNTSNYLLLTNHEDALPLDDSDRRIFFVRSPFATKEELFAAIAGFGLSPDEYFDTLFDEAIKKHAGALRGWMMNRKLSPEFRADGRAPITEARGLLIEMSKSEEEIAVSKELDNGGKGIYQDIVSVTHLVKQAREHHPGLHLRTRRISSIMASLGWAPYKQIRWDGDRCRIYLKGINTNTPPLRISSALDRHEADRVSFEAGEDFAD